MAAQIVAATHMPRGGVGPITLVGPKHVFESCQDIAGRGRVAMDEKDLKHKDVHVALSRPPRV